jgi:diguanylate cyclase (GGDEF)-like protein/PAS domain S-box-containing protein
MYARLISNIPVGVYSMRSVTDGRFWIEYVSPRMFEMMGMSSGNFTSDINNAFSAVHPEDREGFARLHIHSIRGHEPFEWEGRTLVKGEVKWTRIESYPLEQENGDMVWTGVVSDITEQKLAEMALEESNQKLALLSITDGLTGISNRRRFDEALSIECGRHVRSGGKLSLILLDIDHFKAFNDIYGHVHGDECLRRIARVIADCAARATDLPARYGGEEFACILPETDIGGALAIAERIRSGIESLAIPHDGSHVSDSVTASLGVLTVQPVLDGSINEIVHRVDELLYQAKSLGRNRIEYAKWP